MKQIYFFIGTTAEFIKLAPVLRRLKEKRQSYKIVTSGQNTLLFDELERITGKQAVYYEFQIKPPSKTLHPYMQFGIWMFKAVVNYLLFFFREFNGKDRKQIYFIVHGDTISACLGAVIAKLLRVKVVHIESGLRSFKLSEPFPEELCRIVISFLADIHFAPNDWALNNLARQSGTKISTGNNTLIESLNQAKRFLSKSRLPAKLKKKKYFVLVLHRQEHMLFKQELTKKLIRLFSDFASKEVLCVIILHKLTEKFLIKHNMLNKLKKNKHVILLPRLPYLDFVNLLNYSEFIATDGGSNQEEAYFLGKPCVILRDVTERIEGLGENAILSKESIDKVSEFIKDYSKYRRQSIRYNDAPSEKIVEYMLQN